MSKKLLLLSLITLAVFSRVSAIHLAPIVNTISGTNIVDYSTSTYGSVSSYLPNYDPTGSIFPYTDGVEGSFSFGFNQENGICINSKFTVALDANITYYTMETGVSVSHSVSHSFEITFDPDAGVSYKASDLFTIPGAYNISATVTTVAITSTASTADIVSVLEFNAIIKDTRYYFKPTSASVTNLNSTVITNTNNEGFVGDLRIYWDANSNTPEEYELEYTFINDYTGEDDPSNRYYSGSALDNLPFDFGKNSTLIRVTSNEYHIPIVFEHGYLIYRVRPIWKLGEEDNPGDWNLPSGGTFADIANTDFYYYVDNAHEDDLKNWQITTTFSELGKNKSVVSYYDGTFRKRQVVTRLNSIQDYDNKIRVLVGETIYDENGRPAVDVLPAPTISPYLKYYDKFNKSSIPNTNEEYSYLDINDPGQLTSCFPVALPMSTASGASYYYSSDNSDKSAQQIFLPDANGYPFTQTVYTNDNTGRIWMKSGLGQDHKIGSGHETVYNYATPEQPELDKLFGSEAGLKDHYKKNMVRDANGQISVSYLDAKGHVIATGLAGDVPSNVTGLTTASTSNITVSLLDNNVTSVINHNITSSYDINVSKVGDHVFTYDMTGGKTSNTGCWGTAICHDCKYDLSIRITDQCGNTVYQRTDSIGTFFMTNTSCSAPFVSYPNSLSFTVHMDIGTYRITKILSVNEDAIDARVDAFLNDPNNICARDLNFYRTRELSHIDTNNCHYTCLACTTKVNNYYALNDPNSPMYITPEEYGRLLRECNNNCEPNAPYIDVAQNSLDAMLMDVSPGGQYGEYLDPVTHEVNTGLFPVSVYNTDNKFYGFTDGDWKHPLNGIYKNQDGSPSYVRINSEDDADAGTSFIIDGQWYVKPQDLKNVKDFIEAWQPNWANFLVIYHPEYKYYTEWISQPWIKNAYTYDQMMQSETDYTNATAQNYFTDPGSISYNYGIVIDQMVANDLGFKLLPVSDPRRVKLKTKMTTYAQDNSTSPPTTLNIFEAASVTVNCGTSLTLTDVQNCLSLHPFGSNSNTRDAEWTTLRTYYIAIKQQILDEDKRNLAITGGFCNVCMGNEYFDPFISIPGVPGPITGTCGETHELYKNKVPRFPDINNQVNTGYNVVFPDDPVTLVDNLRTKQEDEIYVKCKKCPIAGDLEHLFDGLVKAHKLWQTCTLNDYVFFGSRLRAAIGGTITDPYVWTASSVQVTSTESTLPITISQNNVDICTMSLVGAPNLDWTKLKSICCILKDPGSNYSFTIYGVIPNYDGTADSAIHLSGTTSCVNIDCSRTLCKKTSEANDLYNLIKMMIRRSSDQTLNTHYFSQGTSNIGSNPLFGGFLTDLLKSKLGGDGQYDWETSISGNVLTGTLKRKVNGVVLSSCTITFTLPPGATSFDLISDLSQMIVDETNVDGYGNGNQFLLKAYYNDVSPPRLIDILVSTNCFPIVRCGDPTLPCDADLNEGNDMRVDFENLLNSLAQAQQIPPSTTGTYLIEGDPNYTSLLKTASGGTGSLLRTWQYSAGIIIVPGATKTISCRITNMNGTTDYCNMSFTAPIPIDYSKIVAFRGLKAKTYYKNVRTYDFTVTAVFSNGAEIDLEGSSSCFNIANCTDCSNPNLEFFPMGATTPVEIECKGVQCYPAFGRWVPSRNTCPKFLTDVAELNAVRAYNWYRDSLRKAIKLTYVKQCLSGASETFNMNSDEEEFHYTLYYYDQAGNLVRTVPPAGVMFADPVLVDGYRKGTYPNPVYPAHNKNTFYVYNSLNELVWQKTPDAGKTYFYYDGLGRIVASQNQKQKHEGSTPHRYSYTLYDELGRVKEVGEVYHSTGADSLSPAMTRDDATWRTWVDYAHTNTGTVVKKEITRTYYDAAAFTVSYNSFSQDNLRSRVSSVTYQDVDGSTYEYGTHYSYDIHGNVKSLVQENTTLAHMGQNYKSLAYDYDLVSGKVNSVLYEKGKPDEFRHKYYYDDDNRLTAVSTSRDGEIWADNEAKYYYYQHGPLARMELSENHIQGLDYAYTIHGWLKGVNASTIINQYDMGRDGYNGSDVNSLSYGDRHVNFCNDVFGFTLSYYNGDYTSIGSQTHFEAYMGTSVVSQANNLYNGNIRSMVTTVKNLAPAGSTTIDQPQASIYTYDQLNRITETSVFRDYNATTNTWGTSGTISDLHTEYTYDADGNIVTLLRNGNTAGGYLAMDNMTYNYRANCNQLLYVSDAVISSNYTDDIDDQTSLNPNYSYDKIGNLTGDKAEEIASIDWTVYGKIKRITRIANSLKPDLEFFYGPDGNRVAKVVKLKSSPIYWVYTYYVRDAQGNVMATYSRRVHQRRTPASSDIPDCLTKLRNITGPTYFSETFLKNAYCTQSWFMSALETQMLSQGSPMTFLRNNWTSKWYANSSTYIRGLVLSTTNYTTGQLIDYFCDSNAARLTIWMYQNGVGTTGLTTYLVTNQCSTFLSRLDIQSSSTTGATPFLPWLYAQYYPGMPYPGASAAIAGICPFPAATTAGYIMTYHGMPGNGNIVGPVAGTFGYSRSSVLYNGIMATASTNDLLSIRNWLTGLSDLITILWNEDQTKMDGIVYGMSDQTLLDALVAYDPCTLLPLVSNLVTWNNVIASVLQTNRAINDFFSDVSTNAGVSNYQNMLLQVYGSIGDWRDSIKLDEFDIYGSSRLGTYVVDSTHVIKDYDGAFITSNGSATITTTYYSYNETVSTNSFTHLIGKHRFELANHLGNVLAVISDKRICTPVTGTITASYYSADIIQAQDYYEFGSPVPGRSWSLANSKKYRYGNGGQEKDNEISGNGNSYSAEYWQYDPRLGRRWNLDPAYKKYCSESPYSSMFNNPIYFSDPNGDDPDSKGDKVERFSFSRRVVNWLKGDGFKNNVNKRAVKEGVLKSDYHENADGSITYQTRRTLQTNGFLKDDNGYVLLDEAYTFNVEEVTTKTFKEGTELTELAYLAGTSLLVPEGTSKFVTAGAVFMIVGTVVLKQIELPVPEISINHVNIGPPVPTADDLPWEKGKSPGPDWKWKGKGNPESGKGNWVNDKTGQQLHPDLDHPLPKGPHWGLRQPDGSKIDIFPK